MSAFDLATPRTEEEALALLRPADGRPPAVLAGGTDLLLDLDQGRTAPRTVVSLRRLPWNRYRLDREGLRIGSTTPLRELELDRAVADGFPALAEAIAAVGGPALRRRATVGGNLGRAAPASDLLPVLLSLDAEVELLGPDGTRTVALDAFLRSSRRTELRSDELIRSVRLPEPRPSAYLWQRVRPANDISQVAVAVAFSPASGHWRAALGGVPPRAVLVAPAAEALDGARPAPEAVTAGARALADHPALVSDRRATEEFRRELAAVLFGRAVRTVLERLGGRA